MAFEETRCLERSGSVRLPNLGTADSNRIGIVGNSDWAVLASSIPLMPVISTSVIKDDVAVHFPKRRNGTLPVRSFDNFIALS
jgi:hypothetical protein